MSREAYTPPDLTSTKDAHQTTTSQQTQTANSTSDTTTSNNTSSQSQAIDLSRDDRGGRPLRANQTYNSANLVYTRTTDFSHVEKPTIWTCIECEAVHRIAKGDALRCRECGESRSFYKVKDYGKMNIMDRTFEAK